MGGKNNICRMCVLPEAAPYVVLDSEGVCNLCRAYAGRNEDRSRNLLESDFIKIARNFRRKNGRYDCLVMCSGGKDSTFALYCIKERYKMNPLAFTFDHGFLTPQARENVRNAAEALKADWMYLKTEAFLPLLKSALAKDKNIYICYLCSLWHMNLAFSLAKEKGIRLLVAGWTPYQSDLSDISSAYLPLSRSVRSFLKKEGKCFGLRAYDSRSLKSRYRRITVSSPLWYYNPPAAEEIIKEKLGWKPAEKSYPAHSTNCRLNYLSSYLALKSYGYTHYHVEMSQMIREGQIDRGEAQRRLEFNADDVEFDRICDRIGLSRNEKDNLKS